MEPPGKRERADHERVGGHGDARSADVDMGGVAQGFGGGADRGSARTSLRPDGGWPCRPRRAPYRPEGRGSGFSEARWSCPHLNQLRRFAMLVIIVRGAGAFRRYHQRADGMFRRALLAEQLALRRLEDAFQYFAALRGFRIGDADAGDGEALLGVPLRVAVFDPQGGLGDEAEASPFEIGADLEDFADGFEGGAVAFPGDDAFILVFDDGSCRPSTGAAA